MEKRQLGKVCGRTAVWKTLWKNGNKEKFVDERQLGNVCGNTAFEKKCGNTATMKSL